MKFTYRAANAMLGISLIPAWYPTVQGWSPAEPNAIACYALAVCLQLTPLLYETHGPGLDLA